MPGRPIREIPFELPFADELEPKGQHVVGSRLPSGYETYLRVFHPFVPWDAGPSDRIEPAERMTWARLAESVGVPFSAALTTGQLRPALPLDEATQSRRPWAVWNADLEPNTADALFEALGPAEPPFVLAFDLIAVITTEPHRPVAYLVDRLADRADAIDRLHELGSDATTPEYVWPSDRGWIVHTDYDLFSTYVACSAAVAERAHDHPGLEIAEVDRLAPVPGT